MDEKYILTLYVMGESLRSKRALENIEKYLIEKMEGMYSLDIIDVREKPEYAEKDNIIATPTLIRELPLPLRRIIGDFSDKEKVLVGLELITAV